VPLQRLAIKTANTGRLIHTIAMVEIIIVISAQSVYCERLREDIVFSLSLERIYSMSFLFRVFRVLDRMRIDRIGCRHVG